MRGRMKRKGERMKRRENESERLRWKVCIEKSE